MRIPGTSVRRSARKRRSARTTILLLNCLSTPRAPLPMRNRIVLGLLATVSTLAWADEPPLRPDQTAYLDLYKEFVETNTTVTTGSCTELAEKIAGHLKTAGFEDNDITLFSVPDHPKEGGIVAILHGSSKTAKPM